MMKKIMILLVILVMQIGVVSALDYNGCEIVASFRLNSSLDEDVFICKNKDYGSNGEKIYYDSINNIIYLKDANIYYFTNYNNILNINIKGNNNIRLLHLDTKTNITGDGSLKFREDSYVRLVENGDKVYRYVYNNSLLMDNNKKIFVGTLLELAKAYDEIKNINNLPDKFKEEDYELIQEIDYINMTPVSITPSWLDKYINIDGTTKVENGYGIIKGKEIVVSKSTLKSDNVTLISEKKLNKKYKLKVKDNSKDSDKYILDEGKLLNIYDISIFKGKKQVSIKDGMYTIKIKVDEDIIDSYDNYQIVYITDDGIKEYINASIKDGYIIFNTTHLSQYGIVGKNNPVKEEVNKVSNNINNEDNSIIIKILFMGLLVLISIGIIVFISYKYNKIVDSEGKA